MAAMNQAPPQPPAAPPHPAPSGPPHQVNYEDFVAMSGALPVLGLDPMLAQYRLTAAQWTEVSAYWNDAIPKDPRFGQFSLLVQNETARIRAGGAPRPVLRGGSQPPGGVPHQPYQPYQPPQGAQDFGREVGSAFNAFGNAVGSFVDNAVGTGIAPGARVNVMWSDGKRYPGTVSASQGEQVEVAFPDGRRVWVPRHAVSPG
jgi:hypothetical protein